MNIIKFVSRISFVGMLLTYCSLAVSFLLGVNVINPFFAIIFMIAFTGFYLMTKV